MDSDILDLDTPNERPEGETRQRLERTTGTALVRARLDLSWRSALARHCDSLVAPKLNLWRDLFPPQIEQGLFDQPRGHMIEATFGPGELVAPWRPDAQARVRNHQFNRLYGGRGYVQPRVGRFYPRAILQDLDGVFRADHHPCRLTQVDGERINVDFNHPLAERPLRLRVSIEEIWAQGEERGGRCNEVAELITANGPGMQARWRDLPTDFWSDQPFRRRDPRPDPEFYREPRLVDHLDRVAIAQIQGLYGRLVPAGSRVLDLMSSWHSHLPGPLAAGSVVGLGLNRAELEANPALGDRVVQDLNDEGRLPFPDGDFDAVVCTASVEYLVDPFAVFREVARVLRPGGVFVVTFSNRWFPPKAIAIWEGIHEFERPGLILEYFAESGAFRDLETWSLRGLPRPADDKYADQLAQSDPLYGVWGYRD
ncbi:MAG: methyltransferase domain-containing protein [Bdellovibrio bacteriovorus]